MGEVIGDGFGRGTGLALSTLAFEIELLDVLFKLFHSFVCRPKSFL
jgi:hypothetical protein